MLMDISIYVSLIHLRYVFNNVEYRIKREREREGGIVTLLPSPGSASVKY